MTARLRGLAGAKKPARGVQKDRDALAKLFPAGRASIAPAARIPASMRSAGRAFEIPSRNQNVRAPAHLGAQCLASGGHSRAVRRAECRRNFTRAFDAAGKKVRISSGIHPAMNPLLRHTAWHVTRPLNLKGHARRRAAADWAARFQVVCRHPELRDGSTCAAHALRHSKSGPQLTFIIEGDDFLQNVPGHCRHAGADRAGEISGG